MRQMARLVDLEHAQVVIEGEKFRLVPIRIRGDPTVAAIVRLFGQHAAAYYRAPDGKPTSEVGAYRPVLNLVRAVCGRKAARDFAPLDLKAIRQAMIAKGWHRKSINISVGRVKRVFKWAVAEGLAPAHVHHGLLAVAGLRAGRTEAKESEPIKPVADAIIQATLPFLTPTVAAMVKLQRLTGARPGEVCALRTCDVDRAKAVWTYTPAKHKTAHHGRERVIFIGPKAQEVLWPFLKFDGSAFCFSPIESERQRRAELHARRKTPVGQGNAIGTNRCARPKRPMKDHYDVTSYRRAIARACEVALGPAPPLGKMEGETVAAWKRRLTPRQKAELGIWRKNNLWHPHQLRHSAAKEIRQRFGIEAAQAVLGHASLSATEVYAGRDAAMAATVAQKIG